MLCVPARLAWIKERGVNPGGGNTVAASAGAVSCSRDSVDIHLTYIFGVLVGASPTYRPCPVSLWYAYAFPHEKNRTKKSGWYIATVAFAVILSPNVFWFEE